MKFEFRCSKSQLFWSNIFDVKDVEVCEAISGVTGSRRKESHFFFSKRKCYATWNGNETVLVDCSVQQMNNLVNKKKEENSFSLTDKYSGSLFSLDVLYWFFSSV